MVQEVNFTTPWERIDYISQIHKDSGIDIGQFGPEDADQLRSLIRRQ